MEPRAALGVHDAATGRYTLYAGSGGSVRLKGDLAEVLRVPEASVRVVAQDVGGNYGTRNSSYPEYSLVAWAARRLGRPVKWTGDRREMFLSDYQARDLVSTMELALDAEGTLPRPARHQHEQRRRARGDLRAAQQGPRALHHRLPRAGRGGPRPRGAQQHLPALRLPQRGPAPGDVRDGAADRPGRPPPRLRPGGAAAAQPDPARRDALHQPLRHRLRQRRLPGRAGPRARARRLGRLRGPPRGGPPAGALPRHRARQLHRDRDRRAARARAGHRAAGRLHRRGHRHPLGRPGPRDRLRPADRGMARRGAGARAPHRGRHRPGRGRRRLALRALHAPGRGGDGEGLRPARRAGGPARGVAARVRGGGRGVRGAALPRPRDRPRGRSLRGRGRRAPGRRAGRPARPPRGRVRRDGEHAVLPLRLGGVRGRGGPGDRRGRDRPLQQRGRRGARHQPADRARPDPRGHRPGGGRGALGALRLRSGVGPAPLRHLHGLRDAARRPAAVVSRPRSARSSRPRTRSGSAAAARAARPRRSGRWSTRWSTPSPSWAWSTWRCR